MLLNLVPWFYKLRDTSLCQTSIIWKQALAKNVLQSIKETGEASQRLLQSSGIRWGEPPFPSPQVTNLTKAGSTSFWSEIWLYQSAPCPEQWKPARFSKLAQGKLIPGNTSFFPQTLKLLCFSSSSSSWDTWHSKWPIWHSRRNDWRKRSRLSWNIWKKNKKMILERGGLVLPYLLCGRVKRQKPHGERFQLSGRANFYKSQPSKMEWAALWGNEAFLKYLIYFFEQVINATGWNSKWAKLYER